MNTGTNLAIPKMFRENFIDCGGTDTVDDCVHAVMIQDFSMAALKIRTRYGHLNIPLGKTPADISMRYFDIKSYCVENKINYIYKITEEDTKLLMSESNATFISMKFGP